MRLIQAFDDVVFNQARNDPMTTVCRPSPSGERLSGQPIIMQITDVLISAEEDDTA